MFYDFNEKEQSEEYLNRLDIEYRFGCYKENNPDVCHMLGDFLETIKKDVDTARVIFEKNCDDNHHGHSCFKLANYQMAGRGGMPKSVSSGIKSFMRGCEADFMPSCHSAAMLLSSQLVGPPKAENYELSAKLYSKACEGGNANSCHYLSGLYIRGKPGIQQDMAKAFDYSNRACDMGIMYACANVSQMYRKGEGVKKDLVKAEEIKQKAVEMQKEVKEVRKRLELNE